MKKIKLVTFLPIDIYFATLKNYKKNIPALRLWTLARIFIDQTEGAGRVKIKKLLNLSGYSKRQLRGIIKNNIFFRRIDGERLYLTSWLVVYKKICNQKYQCRRRFEWKNHHLLNVFKTNGMTNAYITKVYAETLTTITKNRIISPSINYLAEALNVSRRSVIQYLNKAEAVVEPNYHIYQHIVIKGNFNNWLLKNMELIVAGEPINKNPRAYLPYKVKKGKICLAKRLPNIYHYTGYK